MKLRLVLLSVACLCALLSGCKGLRGINSCNKPQPYIRAASVPPLKVPSGLDALDTSSALRLPALNEPAPPGRTVRDPCLDAPPSFKATKAPTPQA